MEGVVVITFDRDDMLYLCLEAIRKAEPTIPLHVFPDRSLDQRSICNKFNAVHHFTFSHDWHGNTANMCEAMKWASEQRFERTFIVEDDAIVDASFFSWCRDTLSTKPHSFAACGWQYSPHAVISDGPDIQIPWYLSVCACLPTVSLNKIVQHCKPEYYRDMKGYLDYMYPASHYRGTLHYEQDGMVLRVMESLGQRCVWPRRPRATHIGIHGYHMGQRRLVGTFEHRVEVLRLMVNAPEALKKVMAGAPLPEIGECWKCRKPLVVERKDLMAVCVECFHHDRPGVPQTSGTCYYLNAR